jgi:hypothetical protein
MKCPRRRPNNVAETHLRENLSMDMVFQYEWLLDGIIYFRTVTSQTHEPLKKGRHCLRIAENKFISCGCETSSGHRLGDTVGSGGSGRG